MTPMSHEKFTYAWVAATKRLPTHAVLDVLSLAYGLACYDRPLVNIKLQWELDPDSLVENAKNELQAAADWISAQIVDEDMPKDVKQGMVQIRDSIAKSLTLSYLTEHLRRGWSDVFKMAEKLSTDKA